MSRIAPTLSLRWAFRCSSWFPDEKEWTLAMQCIQPEERKRISKFVFKRDGKSSMAGRLLMRKAITQCLQIPNDETNMARTDKGKPFLKNKVADDLKHFNFNVSHQGVYAVLAAEPHLQVGIDIMQIEYPKPQGTKKFFDTMSRQFTTDEWKFIKLVPEEYQQLSRFYRLWCLKESYVKTIGIGIGFDLKRLNFRIRTADLKKGVLTTDTEVYVDGVRQIHWNFEETMLDQSHHVAVALKKDTSEEECIFQESNISTEIADFVENSSMEKPFSQENSAFSTSASHIFEIFNFDQMTENMKPLSTNNESFWDDFRHKLEKPGQR